VAAVSGWCIGGGAELAAACDLRVGDPSAAIRFPGAALGVPAGVARLPLLVGLSHAKDLLMTSRTLRAEDAHRMGFLNRLVPADGLLEEATSLAAAMATNPGAMAQKRALDEATGLSGRVRQESRALRRWQEGARGPGEGSPVTGGPGDKPQQKRRLGTRGSTARTPFRNKS
jgi:enoyl-CoA hydratase/carnithine racemase